MNTHRRGLTAKAQQLCFWLFLCFRLALAGVAGPCRHSVTWDHFLSLNRLIDNQLDNSCFIIYPFTECLNLSKVCCVKAAFPHILDLLSSHFHYAQSSDNRRYVSTLETVIFHLYSQGCVPEINEEYEDSPVRFLRIEQSSPKEALKKVRSVIRMYMSLINENSDPLDWDCQDQYAAEDDPQSTPGTSQPERPASLAL
ncbi:macrophage colony-stimulating factor 1a [Labrus mixtus]|uniref:macrophage colony-stimulating factor 1a n=1 Tax=Labrus mixtus TaxID=508554 RepID=UPI0029C090C9|nr:macrophage colony-stimulating factor 1a [Labrus mixtus]